MTNPTNNTNIKKKENNTMSTNNTVSAQIAAEKGEFSKEALKQQFAGGLEVLDAIAGQVLKVDELFADRADEGRQVLKPADMSLEQLAMHANREVDANAQKVEFTRTFKARPSDGAVAFHEVLRKVFGINAIGRAIPPTFFSPEQKPEYKSVQIDAKRINGKVVEEFIDVPWGLMEFAPLDAQFTLGYALDNDYGFCFQVSYVAPKKHQARVKALFDTVEQYLATNSIYRGKVLEGVGSANRRTGEVVDPKIIDPYNTNRDKIIYTEQVSLALENSVYGVIRCSDALRKAGKNLGKKVLLEGPNGSGKTEAGMAALQIAKENNWTAIKVRWDEDISKVLAFGARVGSPCVVLLEDVENLMKAADGPAKMEQLLELFDGTSSKGREVMLVMTSNHAHELNKSISRPGRINRIISIAELDRESFQRLFETLVLAERLVDIDYDRLFDAFPDCTPVWIVEAIDRAEESVIIRTGAPGNSFATEDFLYEADGLTEQLMLHRSATDRKTTPTLEQAFAQLVTETVEKSITGQEVHLLTDNQGLSVS